MDLALMGYGRMGQVIERAAISRGHRIVAKIGSNETLKGLKKEDFQDCDLCIDFSHPLAFKNHVDTLLKWQIPLIVGTSGWDEEIEKVKKLVEKYQGAFLYSFNFSIGFHLFNQIVKLAAKLMSGTQLYDVAGYELHHNQKIDSPSGSAITLAQTLLEQTPQKTKLCFDKIDRKIDPKELHFASLRVGHIAGTHTILFDSASDTLQLSLQSKNREGFAQGAIIAAEWLLGQKGFFTMQDMIQTLIGAPQHA